MAGHQRVVLGVKNRPLALLEDGWFFEYRPPTRAFGKVDFEIGMAGMIFTFGRALKMLPGIFRQIWLAA